MVNDSPPDILQRISQENETLKNLLDDCRMDHIKLRLIVQILSKSLDKSISSQPNAKIFVVNTIISSDNFNEKLNENIFLHLTKDTDFIKALFFILEMSLEKIPNKATRVFSYLENIFDGFVEQQHGNDHSVMEQFLSFKDQMKFARQVAIEVIEKKKSNISSHDAHVDPSRYRELSIFPTSTDFDVAQDIYLRANKLTGCYDNADDYLDIMVKISEICWFH